MGQERAVPESAGALGDLHAGFMGLWGGPRGFSPPQVLVPPHGRTGGGVCITPGSCGPCVGLGGSGQVDRQCSIGGQSVALLLAPAPLGGQSAPPSTQPVLVLSPPASCPSAQARLLTSRFPAFLPLTAKYAAHAPPC